MLKLAKDRDKEWYDVNTALKFWVLYKTGNLWTGDELLASQKDLA